MLEMSRRYVRVRTFVNHGLTLCATNLRWTGFGDERITARRRGLLVQIICARGATCERGPVSGQRPMRLYIAVRIAVNYKPIGCPTSQQLVTRQNPSASRSPNESPCRWHIKQGCNRPGATKVPRAQAESVKRRSLAGMMLDCSES